MAVYTEEVSTSGIYLNYDHIDKAAEMKELYDQDFVAIIDDIQRVYDTLKAKGNLRGKLAEGFFEIFEIVLKYHKNIADDLFRYHSTFNALRIDLEELEANKKYQAIK